MNPEPGVTLARYTSLRVGGEADYFLLAKSAEEFARGFEWAREKDLPVRVIGGGSNLLVSDAGVAGLVIKAANTRAAVEERHGRPVLVADAGVNLANAARRFAKLGYGGLEWAANVPGTVGGAAVNNAGAFGADTAATLVSLTLIDANGSKSRRTADELDYGYRTSLLKDRRLGDVAVDQVELRLHVASADATHRLVKQFNTERMRSQPRILSAGSVFANPPGSFAGKLIEEAGLKSSRIGGAEISGQHANFIVNPGEATARDVYALMRQAQDAVFERVGVWLSPEIELIGRWSTQERQALTGRMAVAHG